MKSPNYVLAEHILEEDLRAWIDRRLEQGRSYTSIARELWTATDQKVDVTGWSIRRWHEEKKVS